MEDDLLQKEDAYHKENEKLKLRTKELMEKVESVRKFQENLVYESNKTRVDLNNAKTYYHSSNIKQNGAKLEPKNIPAEELNLPRSVDEMGPKAMNNFIRAKLKSVENENSRLQNELKKKNEEIKKNQKEKQSLQEEKDKWISYNSTTKSAVAKLECQVAMLTSKVQARDNENVSLKKEITQLKKEVKQFSSSTSNSDIKINRLSEENEKLKSTIKDMEEEEKCVKESYRKQMQDLQTTIKLIEKHKNELITGFKKQLLLIDNLKKQKLHLESAKIGDITEKEYLKILDWKIE